MKRVSVVLTVLIILSFIFPVQATATEVETDEVQTNIELTVEDMTTNAYAYIEDALKYARDYATEDAPVTIRIPSGKYNLGGCLHIYSNTNLILQPDTTLVKTTTSGNMLKLGKDNEYNYGYDGYKNIKISGGVWDENFTSTSCAMRFAHCSNILIENLTIKDNNNSHHMEFSAADGFTVKGCSFSGYKRTNSADGMAIQIDLIHNTTHFPSYYYYDDTPCRNVTISGCTFENVYSGVGSYSGVVGSYFENIVIENNKFENIKDKAIALFNATGSVIRNNNINGATLGILFEYYPFENVSNRLYAPNDAYASRAVNNDTRCTITDNVINVKRSVSRNNCSGIAVYGGILSDSKKSSFKMENGNLIVKNLLICRNTIKVASSKASGLWLQYLYNSNVLNNRISSSATASEGYNGINMKNARSNMIKENTVTKFDSSIALKSSSKKNNFFNNKFKKPASYGCNIDETSSGYLNFGNTVNKGKNGRVFIKDKAYGMFTLQLKKLRTEKVDGKKVIKWNRYKNSSGYIIYRSTKKNSGYEKIKTVKEKKKYKKVKKKNKSGKKVTVKKEILGRKFTDGTAKKGKKYYYKIMVYRKYNGSYIYGSTSSPIKIKY